MLDAVPAPAFIQFQLDQFLLQHLMKMLRALFRCAQLSVG
jgi:hypothetical protein